MSSLEGKNQILPGLYQCGAYELSEVIDEVKPDLIVCASYLTNLYADEADIVKSMRSSERYIRYGFDDGQELPDMSRIEAIVSEVAYSVASGERVIVHCNAGLNRSGLIVALVIMRLTGKTGKQALEHLRICRPMALTNYTFANYVKELDRDYWR